MKLTSCQLDIIQTKLLKHFEAVGPTVLTIFNSLATGTVLSCFKHALAQLFIHHTALSTKSYKWPILYCRWQQILYFYSFKSAFDTVNHPILLDRLTRWLSFHTDISIGSSANTHVMWGSTGFRFRSTCLLSLHTPIRKILQNISFDCYTTNTQPQFSSSGQCNSITKLPRY